LRPSRLLSIAAAAALLVGLAGCSTPSSGDRSPVDGATTGAGFPVTIRHALGSTTIDAKPKRVATVAWANQEVPLALGVVPVGMAKATYGDEDGDGLLPWVEERLDDLGAKTPVLFDETDSIDFEAVAGTRPDVILAAYSGLSKRDYETLSRIAPTIAYPDLPWGTSLEDMIRLDSTALGLREQGEALVASLDDEVEGAVAERPELEGRSVMFAYFDPNDLSEVGFYTTHDTRPGFLSGIGMTTPKAVAAATARTKEFFTTVSAEDADSFRDVDVIVTYGDAALLERLQADPLIGRIPAVARGSVALLADDTALAAGANPSPLSIGWGMDRYLDRIAAAAAKAG
jgi:iron complex transport system substrate-binding protein